MDPMDSATTVSNVRDAVEQGQKIFRVSYDASRSLYLMIRDCGFTVANPDIDEENFPIEQNGHQTVNAVYGLKRFPEKMHKDDVRKAFRDMSLRPVTLPGMLCLKQQYRDIRIPRIVALGTVGFVNRIPAVVCMYTCGTVCILDIKWMGTFATFTPEHSFLIEEIQ